MTNINTPDPLDTTARTGYSPNFLGIPVKTPILAASIRDDALLWEGSEIIPYTHFSLTISRSRRFARWVAWNIDGASIKKLNRVGMNFTKDPRLPEANQIGNELYADNRLDRGHVVRRADLLWGELAEAEQANKDSFYYTNITPQIEDFNQSAKDGLWGRLENTVFEDTEVDQLRVSMFSGPVLHDDDQLYRDVRLPREYWKLIVFIENGNLKARAFLLTQNLDQLQTLLNLDEFRVYQITLNELEDRTKLHFHDTLHAAGNSTTLMTLAPENKEPLDTPTDIHW